MPGLGEQVAAVEFGVGGLLFDDDCFRFEIGLRRDNTRVRPSGPSEGLYVRLNLATFGGSGYGQSEVR